MKLEGTTMTKMKKLLFLFDTDPYPACSTRWSPMTAAPTG